MYCLILTSDLFTIFSKENSFEVWNIIIIINFASSMNRFIPALPYVSFLLLPFFYFAYWMKWNFAAPKEHVPWYFNVSVKVQGVSISLTFQSIYIYESFMYMVLKFGNRFKEEWGFTHSEDWSSHLNSF